MRDYKEVKCADLIKYASNSRTHSEAQINEIVASINEFGFTNPLLIDENNNIIAGHGRLEAALKIGLETLPCIVLEGLSEVQKAALIIADNKIALNAGWDNDTLFGQLEFLRDSGFDVSLTGFSEDEIFSIMPSDGLFEGECDPDEAPEVTEESVVKLGDLFTLGEHRLLCGDSTNALDVERLMNGQMPNTMITDPPYGVKYEADWRSTHLHGGKKSARAENSNVLNDDRADWYDAWVLFPGNVAYVWHSGLFTDVVMDSLRRAQFEAKQQIIWVKSHFAIGRSDYHYKHEPCWYAVKNSKERNWKGGKKQTSVWEVQPVHLDKNKSDRTAHPTQKPVELYLKPINHHTNPGEYVYDPFAGSGTLMVACEKTQRRALMMEFDPRYVEVILKRYKSFTGIDAVREDGVKYCDILRE